MATSLGEAISLQGEGGYTQKLANVYGNIATQARAQKAKEDLLKAQQTAEQENAINKYFSQKLKYHPLVMKDVNDTIEETLQQINDIKSSGDPEAANKLSMLRMNLEQKFNEYSMASTELYKFDDALAKGFANPKTYEGPKTLPFVEAYGKFTNLEDMRKYAEENPGAFDEYISMQQGFPVFMPQPAIPYQKDLQIMVKNLAPTIYGEDVVSIPNAYGQKELQRTMVRPLYITDAENAAKKNPSAYPNGRPQSIEDIVKNYFEVNPDAYEQAASRMGITMTKDEFGAYSLEDEKKIEDAMIGYLAGYANPELKGKILSRPMSISVNTATKLAAPQAPTKELEEVDYQLKPGAKAGSANWVIPSFMKMDVETEGVNVPATSKVFDAYGNTLTGAVSNATLNRVRLMPYVEDNGNKRPASNSDIASGLVTGVYPFVEFSTPSKIMYTALNNYSNPAIFAGTKYDAALFAPIFQDFYSTAAKVNEALKGKTLRNSTEFNNFVKSKI